MTRALDALAARGAACRWCGSGRRMSSRGRMGRCEPQRHVRAAAAPAPALSLHVRAGGVGLGRSGMRRVFVFTDQIAISRTCIARTCRSLWYRGLRLTAFAPTSGRMGWAVPWFSSAGSDLQRRFRRHRRPRRDLRPQRVPAPGRRESSAPIFTSGRGAEALGSTWSFLDLTPFGRQETWEDSPEGWPQTPPYQWWRRHDEYDEVGS
jgi:hypothetical protein